MRSVDAHVWHMRERLRLALQRLAAAGRSRRPRPDGLRLALVLLIALIVRLVLAPRGELLWDLDMYVAWGNNFLKHPLDVYTLSGDANYPPLTIYLFGAVVTAYRLLAQLLHQPGTLDMHVPLLSLVAKLPTLLADLGTVAMLYALVRRQAGERWALGVATVYALSPAVLLDGVIWGQTDGIPIFFLLLCLVAIFAGRYGWAGVLFGLAVMLKPQPIIFAPLLLVYLYRRSGWRPTLLASGAAGATALAICAPYLVPPRPQLLVFYHNTVASFQQSFTSALRDAPAPPGAVSWNAYNLWWLLGAERSYRAPVLGPLSAATIGAILFLGLLALALAGIWQATKPRSRIGTSLRTSVHSPHAPALQRRDRIPQQPRVTLDDPSRGRLYAALALVAVGFFAVATLQHERYMFPALAFLLLAAACDRRYVVPCALGQLAVFLNIGYVAIWYLAAHASVRAALPWYLLGRTHPELLAALAWAVVGLCAALAALYAADLVKIGRPLALPLPDDLRRALLARWS